MNETVRLAMLSPSPEEEAQLEADLRAMRAFAGGLPDVSAPPREGRADALRPDIPGECLPWPLEKLPVEARI